MKPETNYAKSGDVYIAYQVNGTGPFDLVWAPGTFSHLDMDWEFPMRADFFLKLGTICRLIRFDKRGTGLSDRPTQMATLEQRTDDHSRCHGRARPQIRRHFWCVRRCVDGVHVRCDLSGADPITRYLARNGPMVRKVRIILGD